MYGNEPPAEALALLPLPLAFSLEEDGAVAHAARINIKEKTVSTLKGLIILLPIYYSLNSLITAVLPVIVGQYLESTLGK